MMVVEIALSRPNKRFFDKEALITWQKFMCPHCDQPTGNTNCEQLSHEDEEVTTIVGGKTYRLKNYNCFFKTHNIWEASINYPVSRLLLQELLKVDGVENVGSERAYSFRISMGQSYVEEEVKINIVKSYKNFIKTLEALELQEYPIMLKDTDQIIGIEFPNSERYLLTSSNVSEDNCQILRSLCKEVEGSQPLFINKENTNG